MQLYQETVLDLLTPNGTNLLVREDPKASTFYVDQLTHVVVESPMQLLELVQLGSVNRISSGTLMVSYMKVTFTVVE